MNLRYSMHDAGARFSEVIRHVQEGKTVTVSCRGEPVAEIRPIPVSDIEWILPGRLPAPEFATVLETGYRRGADLRHVATALYAVRQPSEIWFVTLDMQQRTMAAALGFQVGPLR